MKICHHMYNVLTSKCATNTQSDANTNTYDKIQQEYECCKIQSCSEKSSESLESINCNICFNSEKVTNSIKNFKPYSCQKQRKTVDKLCPSERWERRKSGDTIHSKLSCVIKRLDHLIDTYPSQNESLNIAKIQSCSDKSSESLESINCNIRCNSEKLQIPLKT